MKNTKVFNRIACLMLALGMGLSACRTAQPVQPVPALEPDPTTVAELAGSPISLAEFEAQFTKNTGTNPEDTAPTVQDYTEFLERYVNFRLKVHEAQALGLHQTPSLQQELNQYRTDLARPYLLDKTVIDGLVRDVYEKQKEEVSVSHLIVRVDANASPADTAEAYRRIQALQDSIANGLDFEEAAFRYSEEPSARRSRGYLGYHYGGRFVYPFEKAMYATSVGTVSDVIRTQFGYHLVYVKDRQPYRPRRLVSQIVRRPEATPEDSAATLQLMQELKRRAEQGESFATLARAHSQGARARNGGALPQPVSYTNLELDQTFREAVFGIAAVGGLSEVLDTPFGYQLIQLTQIEPIQTLEEAFPRLKQQINRMPRVQIETMRLGQQWAEARGGQVDETLIETVVFAGRGNSLLPFLRADSIQAQYGHQTFATLSEATYTLGDFMTYVNGTGLQRIDGASHLRTLGKQFLAQRAVDQEAASLESRDDTFAALMQDYLHGLLVFKITEDSVWNAAGQDSVGLQNYYTQNKEKYQFPQRMRVMSFEHPSDSVLNLVLAQLNEGASAEDLVGAFSLADPPLHVEPLLLADSTNAVYDQAFGLSEGEHTGLLRNRRNFLILQHDGFEAPRPKSFAEARAEVLNDYQQAYEAAWIQRMRTKYEVRLYPERLHQAFQDDP